jgi:hypothetical protein
MSNTMLRKHGRSFCLLTGLLGGLLLAVLWPNTPLHAVATDRSESFLMATGYLDDQVEGVYLLDCLTGELRGAAISKQNGRFHAFFGGNVATDLGVDQSKNPHYMMVTGLADIVHSGGRNVAPSRGIIYIAEVTSGKVGAYGILWSPTAHQTGAPYNTTFRLLNTFSMRGNGKN